MKTKQQQTKISGKKIREIKPLAYVKQREAELTHEVMCLPAWVNVSERSRKEERLTLRKNSL